MMSENIINIDTDKYFDFRDITKFFSQFKVT